MDSTQLEELFRSHGYTDFRWIDPREIVVAHWVRMKCMFGCLEYGRNAACPPNVPSVAECQHLFLEYSSAVVFHFYKAVAKPEDRYAWTKQENAGLLKLEREAFLAGNRKALMLPMDSCLICSECTGERGKCKHRSARPTPEALAVDLFATVRKVGYPIEVLTEFSQPMNRYAILLVD